MRITWRQYTCSTWLPDKFISQSKISLTMHIVYTDVISFEFFFPFYLTEYIVS